MTLRLAFVLQIDPDVFAQFAQDNGWEPIAEDDEASGSAASSDEDRPSRRWRVPGGELRFVDDTVVRVQYVDISAEPVTPVREMIDAAMTAYDKEDCLEVLDLGQPEETVCHALRLLACTAPGEFDERVLDATTGAFHDQREDVRVTALSIANYTQWTRFLPEVRRLASEDPSDRVRRFAGNSKLLLEAVERIETGS